MDEEDLIFYNLEKACKSVLIENENQTNIIDVSENHSYFDKKHKCEYYISEHLESRQNVGAKELQNEYEDMNYHAKPIIDITTTKTDNVFFKTDRSEISKINNTAKKMNSSQVKNCFSTVLNDCRLTKDQLETSLALLQAVKYCINSGRSEMSKHRKGKVRFRLP
ncbi:Protein of unknown function [Gryllus bimaculatus]|nr:Protein of unknown function [Gryllus bimaculatus]